MDESLWAIWIEWRRREGKKYTHGRDVAVSEGEKMEEKADAKAIYSESDDSAEKVDMQWAPL